MAHQGDELRGLQQHMDWLLRQMQAAGMHAEADACAQRSKALLAQHWALLAHMQGALRARWDQDLGLLAVLPREVLELVAGQLPVDGVRFASKALRAAFDAGATKLSVKAPPRPDPQTPRGWSTEGLGQLLARVAWSCPRVAELTASSAAPACSLAEMLRAGQLGSQLQRLKLSHYAGDDSSSGSSDAGIDEGAAALLEAMRMLTGLRELDLSCNPYLDSVALAPALQALTALQTLDLSRTSVGIGVGALAPALAALTALVTLRLGGSSLLAEGAIALAPALAALTGLEALDLSHNDISGRGLAGLAPGIEALRGLQDLDLGSNSLGLGGAVALAPAIVSLTRLRRLGVSSNSLGAGGAAALVPALRALAALESVDLRGNQVEADPGGVVVIIALRAVLPAASALML